MVWVLMELPLTLQCRAGRCCSRGRRLLNGCCRWNFSACWLGPGRSTGSLQRWVHAFSGLHPKIVECNSCPGIFTRWPFWTRPMARWGAKRTGIWACLPCRCILGTERVASISRITFYAHAYWRHTRRDHTSMANICLGGWRLCGSRVSHAYVMWDMQNAFWSRSQPYMVQRIEEAVGSCKQMVRAGNISDATLRIKEFGEAAEMAGARVPPRGPWAIDILLVCSTPSSTSDWRTGVGKAPAWRVTRLVRWKVDVSRMLAFSTPTHVHMLSATLW